MKKLHICLIEDDPIMGESLVDRFQLEGFTVEWHKAAYNALQAIREKQFSLVISDIRLPDMNGDELYSALLEEGRMVPPYLFITAFGSIDVAVSLMRRGAADYVTKPFDLDELIGKVHALTEQSMSHTLSDNDADAKPHLGVSGPMRIIENNLRHLAKKQTSVLITGESGVGKEHVARLIHQLSKSDPDSPFIAVNCAALSESLLEAELFGYEKGAFTGASRTKKGVFEQANGGTLLLDEVGDMPASMQAKLLRVLQERVVVRVGGEMEIPIQVRLLCATNKDLRAMVESGQIREDLYYRINVVHIHIPALRERSEDILWFTRLFLNQYMEEHPGERKSIDRSTEQLLLHQPWFGNLRQLKHCIERACVLSPMEVLAPMAIFSDQIPIEDIDNLEGFQSEVSLRSHLQHRERDYILKALNNHNWQITETAKALDISRKNLWEKMKKLDIREDASH